MPFLSFSDDCWRICNDEKKIKTKAVSTRPNKFIQTFFFFFSLERRIRKFLSEDFFIAKHRVLRFFSCTDATWREEFLISEASGADARPSARVSRRVRKWNCEGDAGLQRSQRERRRVRYNPESDDYFHSTRVPTIQSPSPLRVAEDWREASAGLAAAVGAVDASPPRWDENGRDCGVADVKRLVAPDLVVPPPSSAPHKGTQGFLF